MRGKMIAGLLVLAVCILAVFPGHVRAQEREYFHEEKFSADHQLKGLFGSGEEYFHVGDWDIQEAKLTLFYTATNLVREEVSDFTVYVNGEPVYSQRIPLTAGEPQELDIALPKRLLKEGMNSIRVESYIRTNEGNPCEDDVSGASWMVIREDSYVTVAYREKAVCRNVADVYKQLTSIEALENERSAVFLPEHATEAELTGAGYVLSGTASNAVLDYDKLKLATADSVQDMKGCDYGAYICEYGRLPGELAGLLSEEQKAAAEDGALIAYITCGNGTRLLLVTGQKQEALQKACSLFGSGALMKQAKGEWRRVSASEELTVTDTQAGSLYLTQTGSYVSGPFKQTASFNVAMNANKTIAAGSEAAIYFRYAQNLDFDRSLVTVFIGDTPVGSKKLEKDSANGDVLKVKIPGNLNITGNFMLNVTFELELKDLLCDMRKQDMPWAYVTNESTLTLKTEEVTWKLFDYYPSPFVYEGKLNDVLVILPAEESKEDMEAMRQIMLTMGRYLTDPSGTLRVCRTGSMGDLKGVNIISIGRFKDNPIVRQLNEQLYFRFNQDGTRILSNEKMKIEPDYGAALGTAQLLRSPYDTGDYGLLIVSGVTGKGMLHAADYLGHVEKNWEIYGDGFAADEESVSCYRFGPDNARQDTFLARLMEQEGAITLLVIGICVLLLMSLSLLFIWVKHRRKQ